MSAKSPESRVSAAIAMVATSSGRLPEASGILAACGIAGRRPGGFLGSIFGRKAAAPSEHQWKDGKLVLDLGGDVVAVALMAAPIPWSELEGPCATSWWWPEATGRMRTHTHHFLVTVVGGAIEPVERRLMLTRMVSAVVRGSDAVGVYWGEGTLVHEPGEFVERAKSAKADDVPATLWLDVRVEENSDGSHRCFTTGMAPLGFLEIEVEKAHLEAEDLMGLVGDVATYIINGRLQIKEGETMGRSATERYKVRHGPSMFDRAPVMRLLVP